MAMHSYVWLCMTMYSYVWLCTYGYVFMAMYVRLCMYGYVCMAMYVWLCTYGYVCMAMYVWLCMNGYSCIGMYAGSVYMPIDFFSVNIAIHRYNFVLSSYLFKSEGQFQFFSLFCFTRWVHFRKLKSPE